MLVTVRHLLLSSLEFPVFWRGRWQQRDLSQLTKMASAAAAESSLCRDRATWCVYIGINANDGPTAGRIETFAKNREKWHVGKRVGFLAGHGRRSPLILQWLISCWLPSDIFFFFNLRHDVNCHTRSLPRLCHSPPRSLSLEESSIPGPDLDRPAVPIYF